MELIIKKTIPVKPNNTNKIFWKQNIFFLEKFSRIATVTDVKFLNKNILVVAHREAAELYLIKIKDTKLEIVDSLILTNEPDKTKYGDAFHPDLISIDKNTIYMTCYGSMCCIVKIINDKLIYHSIILLNKKGISYHGICVKNQFLYLGGCNYTDRTTLLTKYNTRNGKISKIKTGINGYRIKTIDIYQNKFIFGLDTGGGVYKDYKFMMYVNTKGKLNKVYETNTVNNSQVDGSIVYKNHYFSTVHEGNQRSGYILVYRIHSNHLTLVNKVKCHDFPHGIDIFDNKLAYTSYSKSSITILPLSDFIDI